MCNPLGLLGGGGGGSNSSSNADNRTTVNVSTSFNPSVTVDTKGVQNAINALAGNTTAAQLAVAAAIAQSAATNAAALNGSSKAFGDALASLGGGTMSTQIIVAIIGLVGVLIAAHVLAVPKIKV